MPSPLIIRPFLQGVRFEGPRGALEVDTSAHSLRLVARGGRVAEFSASREGLRAAVVRVVRSVHLHKPGPTASAVSLAQGELFAAAAPHVLGRDDVMTRDRLEPVVRRALLDALHRSAGHRWRAPVPLDAVLARVAAVEPTPLVFSPPVVRHRWLGGDVLKHRAAGVALACVERTVGVWERTDMVERAFARVADWQGFYATEGPPSRALRKTLADLGETAAAHDLWALRQLCLSRPVQSMLHLEVLAERARVAGGAAPPRDQLLLIEHESTERLRELLERVAHALQQPRASHAQKIHLLCELLAQWRAPVGSRQLAGIVRERLPGGRAPARLDPRRPTALPPIALPTLPGVSVLATVGEVYREGERMSHCIGTRAFAAARGEAYLFHVEARGTSASIQLDAQGSVVEVAGPGNTSTPACHHARITLGRWGLPLQLTALAEKDARTWHAPGPPVPGGAPLSLLVDVMATAQRFTARDDLDPGDAVAWLLREARHALEGHVWLVETDDNVLALDRTGALRRCLVPSSRAANAARPKPDCRGASQ